MIVYMRSAIRYLRWCRNLRRTAGRESNKVSFRTSPKTGVGIPLVIETTFFYRWGLPRQFANWLAMTGNSYSPRPCASAGTPPLTSAGGKASIHPHTIWGQYAKRSFIAQISAAQLNHRNAFPFQSVQRYSSRAKFFPAASCTARSSNQSFPSGDSTP